MFFFKKIFFVFSYFFFCIVTVFALPVTESEEKILKNIRQECHTSKNITCENLSILEAYQKQGLSSKEAKEKTRLLWKTMCDAGDSFGCLHFGLMKSLTRHRDFQNMEQAEEAFQKSCDGGLFKACAVLGQLYLVPEKKEFHKAASLFQKACSGDGSVASCTNLAKLYYSGSGVPQDRKQALSIMNKACNYNDFVACGELGAAYAVGTEDVKKDLPKAFDLLFKSCSAGEVSACYNLAFLQTDTPEINQLKQKYAASCEYGNSADCGKAGNLYQYQQKLASEENSYEAIALYEKGCNEGNPESCLELGVAYKRGKGVKENLQKMTSFYEKSCQAGNPVACANLGDFHIRQSQDGKRDEKGEAFIKRSCNLGMHLSCLRILQTADF